MGILIECLVLLSGLASDPWVWDQDSPPR